MKQFLAILLAGFVLTASAWQPRSGDLAFRIGSESAFSNAITGSTAWSDTLKFDHVGIVEVDEIGMVRVVEATPKEGVRVGEWQDFLSGGGVVVKRLTSDFDAADVISRAKSHIGEDYDWWYLPDNGKMYCSELVYESFIDSEGNHIFEAPPMNFRQPDGTLPEFWISLFGRLGMSVPEGVAGTNPSDMSKDPRLVEVGRFIPSM